MGLDMEGGREGEREGEREREREIEITSISTLRPLFSLFWCINIINGHV